MSAIPGSTQPSIRRTKAITTSADTGYYSVYRVMGSEETVKNLALESRTELSWLA